MVQANLIQKSKQFFVIAHNIRSLHNVGAIFRSSDAFGVTKLFLTGYTGKPPDSKITKTALGAEQYLPWESNKSAVKVINQLREDYPKITVIGLENNTKYKKLKALPSYKPKMPLVLVLGEEVKGIPTNVLKMCDELVEIPMHGQKESLNVSVAFGIAAYALTLTR